MKLFKQFFLVTLYTLGELVSRYLISAQGVCKEYTPNFGDWDEVNGSYTQINDWASETDPFTRLTKIRWCRQDNSQHFRGLIGTWTLADGSTESHEWGQVREFEDDVCGTHFFPDELMFGQLYTDTNDIEGIVFWDLNNVEYKMRADGTSPSPKFQFSGRPIGFKVWEGKGGVVNSNNPRSWNVEGPLEISFIYNSCNCPATTYKIDALPTDMDFTFYVDTVAKSQTLPFYDNYMQFVYGQDCGKYHVRTVPAYSWLDVQTTGGSAYPNKLEIYTTDLNDIGSYDVDIELYQDVNEAGYRYDLPAPGVIPTYTFSVTFDILCKVTAMTITTVNRVVYNIYTPAASITYVPHVQTPNCGFPMTCTVQIENPDHGTRTPLPTWIAHSVNTFTFQTDDPLTEKIWNLSILCTIPVEKQSPQFVEEQIIVLDVENGCLWDTWIPTTAYADRTLAVNNAYYIDFDNTLTYAPAWTELHAGCPSTLHIYRVIDGVDTPLTTHELNVLNWNPTAAGGPELTVHTDDFTLHGESWTLKIYMESTHSTVQARQGIFQWTIEFRDRCWDHNLVAPTVNNYVKDLWESHSLVFNQMDDTERATYNDCAGYSYTLEYQSTGPLWDGLNGPALSHYSLGNCPTGTGGLPACSYDGIVDFGTIHDFDWVGVHQFKIKAQLGAYDNTSVRGVNRLYNTVYSPVFTVQFINPCPNSVVNQDGALSLSNMLTSVLRGSPELQIFDGPTDSKSVLRGNSHNRCGQYDIEIQDALGRQVGATYLDMQFRRMRPSQADQFTFNLQTDDRDDVGVYPHQLHISLSEYPTSTPAIIPFTCTVIECQLLEFDAPFLENEQYVVTETRKTINFEFKQAPCDYVQTLSIRRVDIDTRQYLEMPLFVTYSRNVNAISFYSTNDADEGFYEFEITSTLDNSFLTSMSVNMLLQVVIPAERVPENDNPYFLVPVQDECFHMGHAWKYTLGPALDLNGNVVDVRVDLGKAERFVHFSHVDNTFQVLERNTFFVDIGYYFIKILIIDDDESDPASVPLNFTLCVSPDPTQYPGDPPDHFLDSRYGWNVLNGSLGEYDPRAPVPHIEDLSFTGLLKIGWNMKMALPYNSTTIPEDEVAVRGLRRQEVFFFPPDQYETLTVVPALELKMHAGVDSNDDDLIFEWDLLGFTEDFVYVQLNFNTPGCVSQNYAMDTMNVTFWHPEHFKSADGIPVRHGTQLVREVVRQLDPETAKNLGGFGSFVDTFLKIFLLLFLVCSVLFTGSLIPFWAFINTMQLILHTPLLNTLMPGNVAFFVGRIFDLSRLGILPVTQWVQGWWGYEPEGGHHVIFETFGYQSRYLLANLGFILIAGLTIMVFWAFAAFKDFQVKKQKRIFQKSHYAPMWLFKHEPWMCNFAIRFFYEAYLEICICVFINMSYMNFDSFAKAASSLFAIALLLAAIGFLLFVEALFWRGAHIVEKMADEHEHENASNQFVSIEEMKREQMMWFKQREGMTETGNPFPGSPMRYMRNEDGTGGAGKFSNDGLIEVKGKILGDLLEHSDSKRGNSNREKNSGRGVGLRSAAMNYEARFGNKDVDMSLGQGVQKIVEIDQKTQGNEVDSQPNRQESNFDQAVDESRLNEFFLEPTKPQLSLRRGASDEENQVDNGTETRDLKLQSHSDTVPSSHGELQFNQTLHSGNHFTYNTQNTNHDLLEGGEEDEENVVEQKVVIKDLPSYDHKNGANGPSPPRFDTDDFEYDEEQEPDSEEPDELGSELGGEVPVIQVQEPEMEDHAKSESELSGNSHNLENYDEENDAAGQSLGIVLDSFPQISAAANGAEDSDLEQQLDLAMEKGADEIEELDKLGKRAKLAAHQSKFEQEDAREQVDHDKRAKEEAELQKKARLFEHQEWLADQQRLRLEIYERAVLKNASKSQINSRYEAAKRFKTLFLGLRLHHANRVELVHPLLFLVRRLVFAAIVVALLAAPLLQILIFMLFSFAMLLVLYTFRQWSDRRIYYLQIFNEWAVYLSGLFCLLFTGFVSDCRTKSQLGFAFIAWIVAICVINFLVLSYFLFHTLRLHLIRALILSRLKQGRILHSRRRKHEINPDNIYIGNEGETLTRAREIENLRKAKERYAKKPTSIQVQTDDPNADKSYVNATVNCQLLDELKAEAQSKSHRDGNPLVLEIDVLPLRMPNPDEKPANPEKEIEERLQELENELDMTAPPEQNTIDMGSVSGVPELEIEVIDVIKADKKRSEAAEAFAQGDIIGGVAALDFDVIDIIKSFKKTSEAAERKEAMDGEEGANELQFDVIDIVQADKKHSELAGSAAQKWENGNVSDRFDATLDEIEKSYSETKLPQVNAFNTINVTSESKQQLRLINPYKDELHSNSSFGVGMDGGQNHSSSQLGSQRQSFVKNNNSFKMMKSPLQAVGQNLTMRPANSNVFNQVKAKVYADGQYTQPSEGLVDTQYKSLYEASGGDSQLLSDREAALKSKSISLLRKNIESNAMADLNMKRMRDMANVSKSAMRIDKEQVGGQRTQPFAAASTLAPKAKPDGSLYNIERELEKAEQYLLNDPSADLHVQLAKDLARQKK